MVMNLRNNKGWAMPIVVIIVTVLVIISVALLSNIVQSYNFVGSQDNIGVTYLAGEAALDRWFNVLAENSTNFTLNYTGDSDMTNSLNRQEFAVHIKDAVEEYILNNGFEMQEIAIEDVLNKAIIEIEEIKNMTPGGYEIIGDKMKLIIGIQASAKYSHPSSKYNAINKKVYGQMEFIFQLPEDKKFKLLGPVYSFGDFYVNNSKVDIKGDTYVFGSYPDKILQPQQWYYGGIFALNKANLTIDGNAYSRSFIRTGQYLQDEDKSFIRITKDAICQAIQLFGDEDRVLVYRNAYIFDDLEVNGEDSVIGINGSFIGLSKGSIFHDESSAIVNSSAIHNLHSLDSFMSRIIINGDVLNRGGTFKIDDNGKSVGQIEDASVAWDNRGGFGGNAFYKTFTGDFKTEYHANLISHSEQPDGRIGGFFNLFQIWDVQPRINVDDWFASALDVRVRDDKKNNIAAFPDKISGYWEHEIVGNDRVYKRNIRGVSGFFEDIKPLEHLYNPANPFVLDNIYHENDNSKLKYGNNTWASMSLYNTDLDLREDINIFDYMRALDLLIEGIDSEGDKIEDRNIKDDLLKLTHFFAERTYPDINEELVDNYWNVDVNDSFKETLIDLNDLLGIHSSNEETRDYILDVSTVLGTYDIDELHDDGVPYDINELYNRYCIINGYSGSLYNNPAARGDKYYLVVNSDPNVNLEVSGAFNGIIFTAGKVYLRDGADIWGAVIAAGYTDPDGAPDIDYVKVINEEDVVSLNAGKKAGIIVESGATVKIDFYLGAEPRRLNGSEIEGDFGALETAEKVDSDYIDTDYDFLSRAARARLLKKFKDQGIDLTDIF